MGKIELRVIYQATRVMPQEVLSQPPDLPSWWRSTTLGWVFTPVCPDKVQILWRMLNDVINISWELSLYFGEVFHINRCIFWWLPHICIFFCCIERLSIISFVCIFETKFLYLLCWRNVFVLNVFKYFMYIMSIPCSVYYFYELVLKSAFYEKKYECPVSVSLPRPVCQAGEEPVWSCSLLMRCNPSCL